MDLRRLYPGLEAAVAARAGLLDADHQAAVRLFNGFYEGEPALALDVYARTLVLHDYGEPPLDRDAARVLADWLAARLPWLRAAIHKPRGAVEPGAQRGSLLFGERPDRRVREDGVRYAVDLLAGRDAGLYLDTRLLRAWARRELGGQLVLNAFAYTGSLGVAALAGGAARVVQLDQSRRYLNLAKETYALNGFPVARADFITGDFFAIAGRLRRAGARFDCVFLDPPFFSVGPRGSVDLERGSTRLINKARPLVADGGRLVAVNNALYRSGADYLRELEELCAGGYLQIEELVPIPPDFTGYPATRAADPPADPTPFNHPTKIAVLRVRRKDAAGAVV